MFHIFWTPKSVHGSLYFLICYLYSWIYIHIHSEYFISFVINVKIRATTWLKSNMQCHNNQPRQITIWCVVHNNTIRKIQARSTAVYESGGCQVRSLVMRGRLDFLYTWVLQGKGLSAAVGFHLVLVSTQFGFIIYYVFRNM